MSNAVFFYAVGGLLLAFSPLLISRYQMLVSRVSP